MGRIYIIGAIVAALLSAGWWINHSATKRCESRAVAVALDFRNRESALLAELERARGAREIVYRDKIKIVEKAVDPSGCLDTHFPDDFIDGLRQ